jgi:hypothetical protein
MAFDGVSMPPPWMAEFWLSMDLIARKVAARPPIVMCDCEDWLHCRHPWPRIVSFAHMPLRDES